MRPENPIEDPELAALFRAAHTPLADAGFVAGVMARLRRRERARQAVLAAAAAAGMALALVPTSQLLTALGREAAVASLRWTDAAPWTGALHRLVR